jgi:hypothetical protein
VAALGFKNEAQSVLAQVGSQGLHSLGAEAVLPCEAGGEVGQRLGHFEGKGNGVHKEKPKKRQENRVDFSLAKARR